MLASRALFERGRMPLPFPCSLLAAWLAAAAPASATPGPTLAREDTMHTEVSEVLVDAPRVTLDEILDRVARGEARRDSLMHDQSFRTTLRMVIKSASPNPQLFLETVTQVYKKRPDKVRSVLLRKWRMKMGKGDKGDKDDDDMQLDFGPGMREEIVNFAFQPSARRDF